MRTIRLISLPRVRQAALLAVLVACATARPALQGPSPREWRDYAGGPDSSRYVAATQITKDNVGQLAIAWTYPAGQTDFNAIVARGTIYTLAAGNAFVALDAATGRELWRGNPIPGFNVRGANYW